MSEDFYYLDEGHVKITAASVGISSKRWTCINENDVSGNNYQDIMKKNRFDVLPIISIDNQVNEFFKASKPNNYENILRLSISQTDKLSLDTDIRQVINKFNDEKRTYNFLIYDNNVTGLITIGNLNCRQVQVYIFSKICDLERTLSDFINDNIENDKIKDYINEKAKTNDKFNVVLYNYQELISLGFENKITEHLYLVDFFDIVKKFSLNKLLGFSNPQWKDFSSVNELRNLIAHPTRSLLDHQNDIGKLSNRLNVIDDLTNRLKEYQKNS